MALCTPLWIKSLSLIRNVQKSNTTHKRKKTPKEVPSTNEATRIPTSHSRGIRRVDCAGLDVPSIDATSLDVPSLDATHDADSTSSLR